MPQNITFCVQPGDRDVRPLPPVQSGAAHNGAAWLSLLTDTFDDTKAGPVPARVGILGADGKYRPALSATSYDGALAGGKRWVTELRKGDQGLVVTATGKYPIGVCVEYAKA